ncbi:MAG: DUF1460 domain-containing protein [Bacteroides sp.]|nr:DUF1460 domain-containing protein [Bacteroides sp.]
MKTISLFCLGLCLTLTVPLAAQPHPSAVTANALKFLNTPYVAHTLEQEPEQLIIRCNEVDCIILVEYVMALTLSGETDCRAHTATFVDRLRQIRYRNGEINGYASRLHYVAEWIENGVKAGFIKDITAAHNPHTQTLRLNFMSTHPESYRQLRNNPDETARMAETEKRLSGQVIHWLPKEELPDQGLPWIQDGDILALTTQVDGLDVSHMGIAVYIGDELRLLHASSQKGKVVIEDVPLRQTLANNKGWTGIRVLRLIQ